MPLPEGIRGVLLDVEGTTTPISFVHDILFPFARRRLGAACAAAAETPALVAAIDQLRREYEAESTGASELPPFDNGAPYARHLMDQDRKSTGLKALQGILWQEGYRSGELKATVFDDVPPAFRAWRESGRAIRIFSSGSVLAQKLLFAHTDHGDLTPWLDGYHDTTTGPKGEADSYRAIAAGFELEPPAILFLSDVTAELDGARDAGMQTGLLVRPGNAPTSAAGHPEHSDFRSL